MQQYAIRRRSAWKSPEELELAGARSTVVGEAMPDDVRWIRTYALAEPDGTLGSICIYQAVSPEAIREHAQRVGMPADEITPVADVLVVRPDPQPVSAAG